MTRSGDALSVTQRPSPNHGERTTGPLDILLLHYTGMPDADQALDWLCNAESGVSCHYFVHEDGRTVQLVDEDRRAWHAGASCWAGETDINSRSIGIEIANYGHAALSGDPGPALSELPPFPEAQIDAVIALCRDILARHAVPAARVLAHSDVAPARKEDPGEAFPWARLADAGIGHWVEPEPIQGGPFLSTGDSGEPVEALQSMLGLYGYELPVSGLFDEATKQVVTAFQRHFRPSRVDGIADVSTVRTLHKLMS
ncbi:MAG TPA: N-acetylmuramoyl-L-alanine amidase [Afifellaceae bacterium]|nr:N-acetylmuramoyl-L-alanine amidase [Afifellaceae bacterium]